MAESMFLLVFGLAGFGLLGFWRSLGYERADSGDCVCPEDFFFNQLRRKN